METILQIENLDKKFGKVHAVKNLSFNIQKGNVYGILGPNGSGKSTTLGMLLNVVNPSMGTYKWFNDKISNHEALKKVGAIIERPNFYPYMTAYQNLALVCKIKGIPETKIDQKLQLVNLFERKNDKFKTYSLGMKQRLAIASALLNDPEILILDEPTNGLDPKGIQEIRNIIQTIAAQGTTILLASHLLDEVEKVCTHVVVLQQGNKLYDGSTDLMTASHGIIELNANVEKEKLISILLDFNGINKVEEKNNLLMCSLNQEVETVQLNKYLFDNGIILTHLRKTKPTLEQRFLDLTK